MRLRGLGWRRILGLCIALAGVPLSAQAAGVPQAGSAASATVRPARVERESAHFRFRYVPGQISEAMVADSMAASEEAYALCAKVFPVGGLKRKVRMELTPSFVGASGYADPGAGVIAIRVPELEYLGLDLRYVVTHEVAHVFTHAELMARGGGPSLVTGPWGEGIADYAAGRFQDIALAEWWGPALQSAGLWADPRWLLHGTARPEDADFVRRRTSEYDQAALFVRYLVDEYGSDRFFQFYTGFAKAAGEPDALSLGARPQGDARRNAVASRFTTHFGAGGAELLSRWRERLGAAVVPAESARRLTLHQRIYGSVREFETQRGRAARRGIADDGTAGAVREAFLRANQALRGGDLTGAAEHLERARDLARLRPTGHAAMLSRGPVSPHWEEPGAGARGGATYAEQGGVFQR